MGRVALHSMFTNEVVAIFREIEKDFHKKVPNLILDTAMLWNTTTDYLSRQAFYWSTNEANPLEWNLSVTSYPRGFLFWKSYQVEIRGEYWVEDFPIYYLDRKLILKYPFEGGEKKDLIDAMREIYNAIMSQGIEIEKE